MLASAPVWAGSKVINVQGKLTNASGNALTNPTVTFRLYTVPTGGSAVWSNTLAVTTSNGLFNVPLQGGTPSLDTLVFNVPYYLGMQVSGDTNELSPRQLLGASAYALGSLGNFDVSGKVTSSSATIVNLVTSTATIGSLVSSSASVSNLTVTGKAVIPGDIVQVVASSPTVWDATTSTTFVPSDLHATITPLYANSKIKITASFVGGENSGLTAWYTLARDGVNLFGLDGVASVYNSGTTLTSFTIPWIDTPGSTEPHTYTVYYRADPGSETFIEGPYESSVMLLEEIKQ
jgi:hypothetical protein